MIYYGVAEVPGLQYIPYYISSKTEADLMYTIDRGLWLTDLKRRVQHYGYRYDYKTRSLDTTMYIGSLPYWAEDLADRLYSEGLTSALPDQVIVNEYIPGQGISDHVDCLPCFGDTIVSLTLGSSCIMEYTHVKSKAKVPVFLERSSLVVMHGDARHQWMHGIPARKSDEYHGLTYPRTRRISITFRKVALA
jgi:alkylated DNA repair dioxygenase AlkB